MTAQGSPRNNQRAGVGSASSRVTGLRNTLLHKLAIVNGLRAPDLAWLDRLSANMGLKESWCAWNEFLAINGGANNGPKRPPARGLRRFGELLQRTVAAVVSMFRSWFSR